MLRLSRFALASVHVATRLTSTPTSATARISQPRTTGGSNRRRMPS